MNLSLLVDAWVLAFIRQPFAQVTLSALDPPLVAMIHASRRVFGQRHTRASARALIPLLDADHERHPQAVTSRQLHVLLAIAGADLLERDHLAAFLTDYVDPGVATWYQPVSVTALRAALHTVIGPYEPTKRARLLASLADHHHDALLRSAPTATPFAPDFLDRYARRSQDPMVRMHIAMNPATPARTLRELARDVHPDVRAGVAAHEATESAVLAVLAADSSVSVQQAVASNVASHPATLQQLISHHAHEVRIAVASNPSAAAPTITRLATEERLFTRDVRIAVAGNPSTPATFRVALARDPDWAVREAVGAATVTDAALLVNLAEDTFAYVRFAVAANPTTPAALLNDLGRDESPEVRAAVASNESAWARTHDRLVADPLPHVRESLAGNPRCSTQILRRLAADPDVGVRLAVAKHPATDSRAASMLGRDPDSNVRRAIAARRWPGFGPLTGRSDAASLAAVQQRSVACDDADARYHAALADGVPPELAIPAPVVERLEVAVAALAAGARPLASDVRDAATLPGPDDLAYPTAVGAQERFAHAPVTVRVLPNGRAQRQNGIMMRNCTLSETQIAACQRGTKIIAAFEYQRQRYNISWVHCDDHWIADDLKGVDNSLPPRAVQHIAGELTSRLEGLRPGPPLQGPPPRVASARSAGAGARIVLERSTPVQLALF